MPFDALSRLPGSLRHLDIGATLRGGPITDLSTLPDSLEFLCLAWNKLTGTPCLTRLPRTLTTLRLETNALTGIVDLSQLPASHTELRLGGNTLEGADAWRLPSHVVHHDL